MFKNIKKTFIPMLWFTQEAYLTSNYAHIIKFIIILESLGSITCYGIACIGILIISTGIFLYIKHGLGEEENQVLLSNKSNENDDIGIVNEWLIIFASIWLDYMERYNQCQRNKKQKPSSKS